MQLSSVVFIILLSDVFVETTISVGRQKINTFVRKNNVIGIFDVEGDKRSIRTPLTSIHNENVYRIPEYNNFYVRASPSFVNYNVYSRLPGNLENIDKMNFHHHIEIGDTNSAVLIVRNMLKGFQEINGNVPNRDEFFRLNVLVPLLCINNNNRVKGINTGDLNYATQTKQVLSKPSLYLKKEIHKMKQPFLPTYPANGKKEIITSKPVYNDKFFQTNPLDSVKQMKPIDTLRTKDINSNIKESTFLTPSKIDGEFKSVTISDTTYVSEDVAENKIRSNTFLNNIRKETKNILKHVKDNHPNIHHSEVNKSFSIEVENKKIILPDILKIEETLPPQAALNNTETNIITSLKVSKINDNKVDSNLNNVENHSTTENNGKDILDDFTTIINDNEVNIDNIVYSKEEHLLRGDVPILFDSPSLFESDRLIYNNHDNLRTFESKAKKFSTEEVKSFRGDIPNSL